MQVLQGEELEGLVHHLKLKWQSLNEAYVRLPCVLDTPSKRRRKEARRAAGEEAQGSELMEAGFGGQPGGLLWRLVRCVQFRAEAGMHGWSARL